MDSAYSVYSAFSPNGRVNVTAFNIATAVPSPGNAGSFESGGTLALIQFHVPTPTALAFIFLYHLTQVVPGVLLGVLVLVIEGESLLGKRSVFRAPEVELPGIAEPDPG